MTFEELRYHLPAFIFLFAILSFVWRRVRIKRSLTIINGDKELLGKLSLLHTLFNCLFLLSSGVVFVYAFFNEFYIWIAIPFNSWDIAPINNLGVFILNVSLVWIISTQMHLDTNVYRIVSGNLNKETTRRIIIYSQKSILIGFLIMFVGIFITISSLGSLLLAVIAIAMYYFFFMKKVKEKMPTKNYFIF